MMLTSLQKKTTIAYDRLFKAITSSGKPLRCNLSTFLSCRASASRIHSGFVSYFTSHVFGIRHKLQ